MIDIKLGPGFFMIFRHKKCCSSKSVNSIDSGPIFPQTELGVLTFLPRLLSGRNPRKVASHENQCFFNKNHNNLSLPRARATCTIVDPPFFSYVCSDIDIGFLVNFQNISNCKLKWMSLIFHFLEMFIKQ